MLSLLSMILITGCGGSRVETVETVETMTLITGADELRFNMSGTGTVTIAWGNQKETAVLSEDEQLFILDIPDINSRTVTISGKVKRFECEWGELTAVDVSRNTALEKLRIRFSDYLTSLDLSKNIALTYVDVSGGQFSFEALNDLFGSLHGNGGTINIFGNPGTDDCNKSIAQAKGWKVQTTEYGNSDDQTDDAQLSELMPEIIYSLPAALMPDFLKTEEQRREAVTSNFGDSSGISAFTFDYHHDYGYDQWTIAGYLTDDNRNVLLIVQFGSGSDGFQLKSDKTLNYNIETQEFTEITRPIELPTVDEMVIENIFDNQSLYNKAKAHFGNKMELNYARFDKEGFTVNLNYFSFWGNNDDFDYYSAPFMVARYKWDGAKFYKHKIFNSNDLENEYQ